MEDMTKRRRFKQTLSLQDRLSAWVKGLEGEAEELPPGEKKAELLKKIRQADAAANMEAWANSSGLQPPK
jgi:hypothetical protein